MTANGDEDVLQLGPSDVKELLARVDGRSFEALHAVGRLSAEVSHVRRATDDHGQSLGLLHIKVDGLIEDMREVRKEVRDSIRPKLQSFTDVEEDVTAVTKRLSGVEKFVGDEISDREIRRKAFRRIAWAVVKGAATALGGVIALASWAYLTGHLHIH